MGGSGARISHYEIVNWDKFQHYKAARPAWIKNYVELQDKIEYRELPDVAKAHLHGLWIVAARTGNRIPPSQDYLMSIMGAHEPIQLETLVSAGFLKPCMIDSGNMQALKEKSREERESRGRVEKVGNQASERLSHLELGSELPRARDESEGRVAGEEGFSTAVAELANGMSPRPKVQDLEDELREIRKRHLHEESIDHQAEVVKFLLPLFANGSSMGGIPPGVRIWMGRIPAARIMTAIRDMETGHYGRQGQEVGWSELEKDERKRVVTATLNEIMEVR